MNAEPHFEMLARLFAEHHFEVILIGNAAAALAGAPVTTLDFDFYFRKTPVNMRKLKAIAVALDATILKPFYPVSALYRLVREQDLLQLDFMATANGIKSFSSLRSRARAMPFGEHSILVASLDDIIKSKRATNRPRDRAVIEILEKTNAEKKGDPKSKARRP
jgi:hypothetical protein